MFKFKGIRSDYMGVIAKEEDFFIRAPKLYTEIPIEGRNGSIFQEKGYGNVVSMLEVNILTKNIDSILEWLDGSGLLEYKGRATTFRFYDVVEVKRMGNVHTATLNYIREPFWYKANDCYVLANSEIQNIGNSDTEPIIKVIPAQIGDATITIEDVTFTYTFDSLHPLFIDCAEKSEKVDGLSKSANMKIGYKYPVLKKGVNRVLVSDPNIKVYFRRKDCWK